jgi:hypothetical protein
VGQAPAAFAGEHGDGGIGEQRPSRSVARPPFAQLIPCARHSSVTVVAINDA